nr:MAG TPA: hypothetical protein [Caudoviricetes sp.]
MSFLKRSSCVYLKPFALPAEKVLRKGIPN